MTRRRRRQWPPDVPTETTARSPITSLEDYVSGNGGIRWHKQWVNVTSALIGEYVGLEPIDDGLWDVYFGVKKIGRLHERHMRIEGCMGRFRRHP
jgi:hypothetical protein